MITKTDSRGVQNGKELVRLAFKSTDSKPTTGIMNGSTGIEVNTGKQYVYDEESGEWTEIASSGAEGGGGGSSDFSTAEVTFENVDFLTSPYNATITSVESDGIKSVTGQVALPFTVTVPLYKGKNILPIYCISNNDESYMPTTEGSVEFSIESMGFVVTGNGTIKAKGLSGGGI